MPGRICKEMERALKMVARGMKPKKAAEKCGVSVAGLYAALRRK